MRPPRSLKAGFLIGSVLWTLGLLGASHMFFVLVAQHFPQVLRVQHWVVLGLLALVFMIGGLSQVRRGLAPVDQLRGRLAAVRDGRSRRIEGDYPAEVQPLVDDLNALIEHREDAVRRAQAKAGNLAHGLKTPLALLSQEAEQVESAGHTELAAGIRQEVDRMRRQIDYHLAHARGRLRRGTGHALGGGCVRRAARADDAAAARGSRAVGGDRAVARGPGRGRGAPGPGRNDRQPAR